MIVYRVEVQGEQDDKHTNVGKGVYRGAILPEQAPYEKLHIILQEGWFGDMTGQPLICEDSVLNKGYPDRFNKDDARFAFASVASYHSWFKSIKGRKAASRWGILQAYDVPAESVVVGEAQCLVIAEDMTPRITLPLDYVGELNA